jgi:hypothetical protein
MKRLLLLLAAGFPGAKITVLHGADFVPGLTQALQVK